MRMSAQLVSLWMAAVFGVILLAAFLLFPGFFPPMPPDLTARQVAAFYARHQAMIRLSMVTVNFCAIMLMPFFMVIVYQMKRMATPTQVLAYAYLSAAVSGATLIALADLFWLVAAFRPDRDPQVTQLLNDLAWITFTVPVGMIIAQMVTLALAIRLDDQPRPVFPRWVAAFNIAIAVAVAPSAFAAVFHTGPLAWNRAVSFWLRVCAYVLYVAVMFVVVRAAVRRQHQDEREQADGTPLAAVTADGVAP
jgi:membrane protein implicated in regulation of membrane protease activity